MMVGDSEHDFEVARALGVRCVLFSGGHQPREVLAATGAPVIDALVAAFASAGTACSRITETPLSGSIPIRTAALFCGARCGGVLY